MNEKYFVITENKVRSILARRAPEAVGPMTKAQAEFIADTDRQCSANRGEYLATRHITTELPEGVNVFSPLEWLRFCNSPSTWKKAKAIFQ